jgi:hypothetical protein
MKDILIKQLVKNYKLGGRRYTDVGDLRQIGKTTALIDIASQLKQISNMSAASLLLNLTENTPVVVVHNEQTRARLRRENPLIEFATLVTLGNFIGCPNLILLVDEGVPKNELDTNIVAFNLSPRFVFGWKASHERDK